MKESKLNLVHLNFNIEKEGSSVFPFTYIYKVYKSKTFSDVLIDEESGVISHPRALQAAHKQVLSEVIKDMIALYHFYLLIPETVKKQKERRSTLPRIESPCVDYDAQVNVTMAGIAKFSQKIYANLIDLRLAEYMLTGDVNPLGKSVLEAGEGVYRKIFNNLKISLSFKEPEYPPSITQFIQYAIENIGFASKDKPVLLNRKEDELLDFRHDQFLKGIVLALGIVTGVNYYDQIIEAERYVLHQEYLAAKEKFQKEKAERLKKQGSKKASVKPGIFSGIFKFIS